MLSNHSNLICDGKQINTNSGIYEKIGIPTSPSGLVNTNNSGAKVVCQRIYDKTLRIPCYTSFPKSIIDGVSDLSTLTQTRVTDTKYMNSEAQGDKYYYVLITHYLNDHFEEEAIRIDFKFKNKETLTFMLPIDYDVTTAAAMFYDEWNVSYNDDSPSVTWYTLPIASLRVDSDIYTISLNSSQVEGETGYNTMLWVSRDSDVWDTGTITGTNFTCYTKYPSSTDNIWFVSNFEQIEFLFNFESSGDVSDYIDAKMDNALRDFSNYFCVR